METVKAETKEERDRLWGASIIAGILFWVLNFGAGIILEFDSFWKAIMSATIKAVIFAVLFFYLHNFVARLLGWHQKNNE